MEFQYKSIAGLVHSFLFNVALIWHCVLQGDIPETNQVRPDEKAEENGSEVQVSTMNQVRLVKEFNADVLVSCFGVACVCCASHSLHIYGETNRGQITSIKKKIGNMRMYQSMTRSTVQQNE